MSHSTTLTAKIESLESRQLLAAQYDYLSDLQPTFANNGFGPVERDLSNGEDGANDGAQIKINGQRYTKGLGMHAQGEVHFELNGRYKNLISDVGVDDEAGRVGSAVFQVYADGEKMFDSGVMTGMNGAKRVNIDVTGKREMVLILSDAGDGTDFDHGDWAGARLVRPDGAAPVIAKMPDAEIHESRPMLQLTGLFTDATSGPYVATVDYGDGQGRQRIDVSDTKNFELEHVYNTRSDGDYTVTVRISNGVATGVSTFRVAVRNDAPMNVGLVGGADETGALKALAGISVDMNGIFTDPGQNMGERYTAMLDFGDGSPLATVGVDGRFFSTRHVYRKSGTYTVTSTITDEAGKTGVGTNTIFVIDPVYTYLSSWTPTNGGTFMADRAADGSNLKINGSRYSRGIGVTADSTLTYALDGQYQSLIGDVGVDDKVGANGSVMFQVFGDGVLMFESGPMTGRDGARRMNVDVRNVSEIQLVVTHVGDGSATNLDRADWAGIRVVYPIAFRNDQSPTRGAGPTSPAPRSFLRGVGFQTMPRLAIVALVLIGILSDSHGRFEITKRAIELLRSRGVDYLIHCGDVGEENIIDLLAGEPPAAFVWGNNDYDRERLAAYAKSLGVTCLDTFGLLELGGKRIAVTHGDHLKLVHQATNDRSADYLLVGHTHVMVDRCTNGVRVINPGALYRASIKSCALLQTDTDALEFLTVT
jgi:putative phosphoesterase